jgi:3-oxoacyl-[acyl-carrier protein] reductase
MDDSYRDSVIVVTGASTGLGRAIAVGAAARGARAAVINFARSVADAEETARLVRAEGAEAILGQGDVGEESDCRAIVAAAAPFGRIDTLFNNAGMTRMVPCSDLDALSGEDFLALYRVNVVAARALLEASEVAAVVNTSSIAGVTGGGSSIAYSVSKGALNTLTLSLARALAPKIRVNTICPGFIDSPWFDKLGADTDKLREHIRATTPLRTVSTPEDIAEAALFLGSRAARHVTGETLLVDAGLHLNG